MNSFVKEELMKYVYICSPYRPVGENPETELRKNIDQAKRACRLAEKSGWCVYPNYGLSGTGSLLEWKKS